MSNELKIGDRVVYVGHLHKQLYMMSGVIVRVGNVIVGVDFDFMRDEHRCDGNCADGHGWLVCKGAVRLQKA